MLRFRDLTEDEIDSITNGCGSKGSRIKVPNFLFKASCIIHDFYYWRGCSEKDRKKADKAFYKYMKLDIKDVSIIRRPYYYIWAYSYYVAVRIFGKKAFNYDDKMKEKV